MADEEKEGKLPPYNYKRKDWPPWKRKFLNWLYTGKRRAGWLLEDSAALRLRFRPNHLTAQIRFDSNMIIYNALETIFYETNSSLFDNVDMTTDTFAKDLFDEIESEYKPDEYNDVEDKIDEYNEALEAFDGNPTPYFEKLIRISTDLKNLNEPDTTRRDIKRIGDIIFKWANTEGADPIQKSWGEWLTLHQQLVRMAGVQPTFETMKNAAVEHYNDTVRRKPKEKEAAAGGVTSFRTGCKPSLKRRRDAHDPDDDGGSAGPSNPNKKSRGGLKSLFQNRGGSWRGGSRGGGYGRGGANPNQRNPGRGGWRVGRGGASRGGKFRGRGGRGGPRGKFQRGGRPPQPERRERDEDEEPVYDRNGNLIDCYICGENHHSNRCPFLPEINRKYMKRQHQHPSGYHTVNNDDEQDYYDEDGVEGDYEEEHYDEEEEEYGEEEEYDQQHQGRPVHFQSFTKAPKIDIPGDPELQMTMMFVINVFCLFMRQTVFSAPKIDIPGDPELQMTMMFVINVFCLFMRQTVLSAMTWIKNATIYIANSCMLAAHVTILLCYKITCYIMYAAYITGCHWACSVATGILFFITFLSPIQPDFYATPPRRINMPPLTAMINKIAADTVDRILHDYSPSSGSKRTSDGGLAPTAHFARQKRRRHCPPLKKGEMYMVADSGANRHFIPEARKKEFMYKCVRVNERIGGLCGRGQTLTGYFGVFAASTLSERQVECNFESIAFVVDDAVTALFSEVQCCFQGHTIIHEGHPVTGRHGILLKSGEFIPYIFDIEEGTWLLKVRRQSPEFAEEASKRDPYEMLRRSSD